DEDGICDDVDECVGDYDECGVCNGDGTDCLNSNINFLPETFFLSNPYPNPFNPYTVINYGVPYSSNVSINIYNSLGYIVDIPLDEYHLSGLYSLVWNPINLPSGVYYIQFRSDRVVINKKVVYLK
ncbi:MAG: hypothetical protein CBB66_03480, partial [bacterium TMED6]